MFHSILHQSVCIFATVGFCLIRSIFLNMCTPKPLKCVCRFATDGFCLIRRRALLLCFGAAAKYICQNCRKYLSKLQNVFVQFKNVFVQIMKCICPNYKMYLSKLQTVGFRLIRRSVSCLGAAFAQLDFLAVTVTHIFARHSEALGKQTNLQTLDPLTCLPHIAVLYNPNYT